MREIIVKELTDELEIKEYQINAVLDLLSDGATIPFIARYRKEATGALDENQIKLIQDKYEYYTNLMERKEAVIRLIDEKGLLTDELKKEIMSASKLTEVEDLYRPFKEKKKTKASEAIKAGLEPLAKKIMSFPTSGSLENLASGYNMETEKALEGAGYIIAEWISDNAYYRKFIRNKIFATGSLVCKKKKNDKDENKVYEMYYDFKETIKYAKSYRILAINRAEKEDVISVNLDFDKDAIIEFLNKKIIKNENSFVVDLVKNAIKDALSRLIFPSVGREIRSELTDNASDSAIDIFSVNLENLLMTRPVKGYRVIGFDPAFRTGCKLACLDEMGNVLHIDVIYPHEPKNDKDGARVKLLNLISKYNINLIAIGNGTASRESEEFVANCIKGIDCKYIMVSEAGASVYSASKLAQSEFPDLEVQERSAISIGRRVQDPLSELVKIEPKSIGVGEYQHDVNQKNLNNKLDFTVEKVVNDVGVNVNTASRSILSYVSGLTKSVIDKILKYKSEKSIKNREELKKIIKNDKVYEQSIGFLRIVDGDNYLDNTKVHPESYEIAKEILKISGISSRDEISKLENINIQDLVNKLNVDEYTISDIVKELLNPGLDPRDEVEAPILRSDVLKIEDLKVGMELKGTVRNVASFGAFVDIGLKNDGLLHISKISKDFIKHPTDVLSVGEIITCYVDEVILEKKKVALTMLK